MYKSISGESASQSKDLLVNSSFGIVKEDVTLLSMSIFSINKFFYASFYHLLGNVICTFVLIKQHNFITFI